MNIVRKDIDKCNTVISIEISKEDYNEKVEKALKEYRKKASIPGFRPGMTPVGLIKKMYGKAVLAEELNKLYSESLYNYVKENNINMLGEPLANSEQEEFDINGQQEDFTFKFDIGFVPEFAVVFDKQDEVPYFSIEITKEMEESQIKMNQSQHGTFVEVAESEADNLFKGDILETGEGEFSVLDAMLMPKYMKDENQKTLFVGKKVGDTVVFNPVTAFDNPHEVSSLLKISKDNIEDYNRDFQYVIKEITKRQDAELNQELFDKVLGENVVKNETEFREKIKEGLEKVYIEDSDYKFMVDVKELSLKKMADTELPVEFLKRWLLISNQNVTQEIIDSDFDKMLDHLKWDLIKKQIADKNTITVDKQDVTEVAKKVAKMQFAQYGMNNAPDYMVDNFAENMLKKEETRSNLYEKAFENKIIYTIKEQVTVTGKTVSVEEFNKFF